jgi:hypothetical protein
VADIIWPADLAPYRVLFYLQPHVGGTESPFTRTRKVYGLSAPRWVARLTFRGGYDGVPRLRDQGGYGPRLDALIAQMEGGLNRVAFHDWRRPRPTQPQAQAAALSFDAVASGSDQVTVSGFTPYGRGFSVGDYIGGDERPHIVIGGAGLSGAGTILAGSDGKATITVRPPYSAPVAAGTAPQWPVRGWFRLTSEDAGQNETDVGEATEYVLDFVEDLG